MKIRRPIHNTNVFGTGLTTGTALTVNTALSYTGNLADLQVNAASQFSVNQAGNVTFAGIATGNGSGLTTLNATNLASGTVPSARLSGAYTGITGVGTLTGLTVGGSQTINNAGTLTISALTTGVAHLNATGVVSSGLITNSDLSSNLNATNITGVGTLGGLTVAGTTAITGATTLTASSASAIPLSIVGALSQTGDYLDVTANGGVAGAIFKISSAGVASGNGSGLTSLNASNISSGTIADARLSTNVALATLPAWASL